MRQDVDFAVEDGTILRGYLHSPAKVPAAGIVMAHGFSGVKEQIDHYAALFAEAGFSVLLYDHRNYGTSDGQPRFETDPWMQISDWRDAITFAQSRPEFDDSVGVGLFGSSFAGGLAMVVAASDARVIAVVAQIPNVSGARNSPMLYTREMLESVRHLAVVDRVGRMAGEEPIVTPVFAPRAGELCAMPRDDVDADDIATIEATSTWRNTVTVRSVDHALHFEPAGWVPFVAPKPLLMIIGERDECTFSDVQRDVFQTAGEPKKLVVHPGGHFDTYTTHFHIAGYEARDWFVEHLPSPVTTRI